MKFPIYKSFQDTQDNKRLNEQNKYYPREGFEPSEERIKELQEKGFIGDEVADSSVAKDLVSKINHADGKVTINAKKINVTGAIKHVGGGYYELSNGERVRGKDEAFKAEQELRG